MHQVLNTLLPVFLVIGLGYVLARCRFISELVLHELNRLLFWVSLPALIIYNLATVSEIPSGTGTILFVFTLSTIVTIVLGLWCARLLGLEAKQIGTFVQSAFRGNLAYTGIPLILFAMQSASEEAINSVLAQTLFVFAPTMLVYNVAAVVLLVRDFDVPLRENFTTMLKQVTRNPLILSSILGVILFALPLSIPKFLLSSLELTGQMSAPVALLCVGGSMAYVSMQGRYRSATIASILKVVVTPCLALSLASLFDLNESSRLVLMILSACPTAVASYIMAKQLKGDEALASGSIVISTIASMPVLAIILSLN